MSKFAKAIKATISRDVKAVRDLNLKYTDMHMYAVDSSGLDDRSYGVDFEATFGCRRWVRDDLLNGPDNMTVYADIKQAMIEEMFGEFRPLLIEMRSASYDEDQTRVRKLLAQLEYQMFHDGE